MSISQGLLLALSLVGGRASVGAPEMKNVSAVASIVRRTDTGAQPEAVGWIVWDDALRPWVAVWRKSPSELLDLVPQSRHLALVDGEMLCYAPLTGALPDDFVIVSA